MDKLKLYAAPLIALVLLLLWFFVIRPKLDESPPPADGKSDGKSAKPAQ